VKLFCSLGLIDWKLFDYFLIYLSVRLMQDMKLTAKDLAMAPFPELPAQVSQRRSISRTYAVTPKTFSELKPWSNFLADARQLSATLDAQTAVKGVPMECLGPLEPCSDEVGVRGALE
jgi:hypothetical protein